MKCPILLAGILVGSTLVCNGQGVPTVSLPTNRVFTRADTLQALHTMFRRGRRWGKVVTVLAPITGGIVAYSYHRVELGFIDFFGTGNPDNVVNGYTYAAGFGIPLTLAFSIVGPLSWAANSKDKEQETIREFEQHLPLSRRIQKRLHNQLERVQVTSAAPSR